jgi:hypothetical protein
MQGEDRFGLLQDFFATFGGWQLFRDQLGEMLLQCASARTRESYDVADGESSVFAGVLNDGHR